MVFIYLIENQLIDGGKRSFVGKYMIQMMQRIKIMLIQ